MNTPVRPGRVRVLPLLALWGGTILVIFGGYELFERLNPESFKG